MGLRVGVLGCGWIAEHAHIPALMKIQGIDSLALFDKDIESAYKLSCKYNIKEIYNKFDDFLNSGIDAAVIATPNYSHVYYSKILLNNGINVLCEKPIAFNNKEIIDILKIAKSKKLIFFPGMVNRYRKDIRLINLYLKNNKLGKIKQIDSGWIRRNGLPRPGTWFTNKHLSGGGVLIDLVSHILDICLMLLGKRDLEKYEMEISMCENDKENVSAKWFYKEGEKQYQINVEDNAYVNIVFDDNIKLNMDLSWHSSTTEADYTYFFIKGENGKIELRTLFGFSSQKKWEKDSIIIEKAGRKKGIYLNHTKNDLSIAFEMMHRNFINNIVNSCRNDLDIYSAYNVISIIEKLYDRPKVVDRHNIENKRITEI